MVTDDFQIMIRTDDGVVALATPEIGRWYCGFDKEGRYGAIAKYEGWGRFTCSAAPDAIDMTGYEFIQRGR